MTRKLALPLLVAAGLVAGCGSDDKSDTSTAPASTSAPASNSSSNSAPAYGGSSSSSASSGSSSASSGGGLTEDASEFKFSNENLTAKAGKVKVTLNNKGQYPHEFVLLKTDAAPDKIPLDGQAASEKDAVGEIPEVDGGGSASHTFNLKPGHYVFVCNVPGHYKDGMHGELTVN